jgi:succinate dehydrogenase hydrophobic membrane anchor protein
MDQSVKHLRSYAKGKSGAGAWMFQRISGVALVVLTVGHYFMMHYAAKSGHDFGSTADRLAQPIYKGLYLAFITIGMYHGVQGLWNIVRDFKLKPSMTYTILGCLVVFALIFLGMGWNTMLTFDPNKP